MLASPEARPAPRISSGDQFGTQCIAFDLPDQLIIVVIGFHRKRFVTPLVYVTHSHTTMVLLPVADMGDGEFLQEERQVAARFWQRHQMPMIGQQTIGTNSQGASEEGLRDHLLQCFVNAILLEQSHTPHTTVEYMRHHSTRGNTSSSGHAENETEKPELSELDLSRFPVLWWEKRYPCVIGLVAAALYLSIPAARNYHMPATLAALMSSVVSIGGIAIGFLATSKSILISIDEREIVKKLKQSGYYKRIILYIRAAIGWSFLLASISALALLITIEKSTPWTLWHSLGFAIWLFLAIGATLSYFRVINIFYAILDTLD